MSDLFTVICFSPIHREYNVNEDFLGYEETCRVSNLSKSAAEEVYREWCKHYAEVTMSPTSEIMQSVSAHIDCDVIMDLPF